MLAHHYSLSYPSARVRFGLFTRGCLVGVAVFSHPCNDRVLTSVFPLSPLESVELGRFVLLDSVPANGESWFLARTFECLARTAQSFTQDTLAFATKRVRQHSSAGASPELSGYYRTAQC